LTKCHVTPWKTYGTSVPDVAGEVDDRRRRTVDHDAELIVTDVPSVRPAPHVTSEVRRHVAGGTLSE
jgi:hypothetical protein